MAQALHQPRGNLESPFVQQIVSDPKNVPDVCHTAHRGISGRHRKKAANAFT